MKLFGGECLDQGHAWQAGDWVLVWRWVGKGPARQWRRIAERRSSCIRECGAVAVDRATSDLSRLIGKRYIRYGNDDYRGQGPDGGRVYRRDARLTRAREQGTLFEVEE